MLHVVVTDRHGRPRPAPGLAAWLAAVAPRAARGDVTIAIVSDQYIRALNRTYRRKDAATDVLSFPGGPHPAHLGDLAIAEGVARRQAREAGHSYATELKVLALHGLLHLLGYDHHAASDAGRMARLERRLRLKGGLGAGLIERSEDMALHEQANAPAARARRRSDARRRRAERRARAGVGPREH